MEYVKEYGPFADLPWDMILLELMKNYPAYFEDIKRRSMDFSVEAKKENR